MAEVTEAQIGECITNLAKSFDDDLFAKRQDELEEYWRFEFDSEKTPAVNLYNFHCSLKLYGSFCRRWEEHHNGTCCVVEHVRDTYLRPKIQAFITLLVETIKESDEDKS